MAGRQRSTFQKRQKEIKRLEKQREKTEKRAARRLGKPEPGNATTESSEIQPQVPVPGKDMPTDYGEA